MTILKIQLQLTGRFQSSCLMETSLSNFHILVVAISKTSFEKFKSIIIIYTAYFWLMMQLHQMQNQLELKSKTSCFLYWQRRTKCKTSHLFEDGLAPNAEVAFSIDGTAPNANPTVFSVGEPKSKPAFFLMKLQEIQNQLILLLLIVHQIQSQLLFLLLRLHQIQTRLLFLVMQLHQMEEQLLLLWMELHQMQNHPFIWKWSSTKRKTIAFFWACSSTKYKTSCFFHWHNSTT